jgi:hypothetical protein
MVVAAERLAIAFVDEFDHSSSTSESLSSSLGTIILSHPFLDPAAVVLFRCGEICGLGPCGVASAESSNYGNRGEDESKSERKY